MSAQFHVGLHFQLDYPSAHSRCFGKPSHGDHLRKADRRTLQNLDRKKGALGDFYPYCARVCAVK